MYQGCDQCFVKDRISCSDISQVLPQTFAEQIRLVLGGMPASSKSQNPGLLILY